MNWQPLTKHLPPSASALRLWNAGDHPAAAPGLIALRPDLIMLETPDGDPVDAILRIAPLAALMEPNALAVWLAALRPGGRLILWATDSPFEDGARALETLERAGFIRILVEAMPPAVIEGGLLIRGERAHTTGDTLARVELAADAPFTLETANGDRVGYRGRFVYLLIRVTPNRPAWAIPPDTVITWRAVTADGALLAFSSLPNAVAFMQRAVLAGRIADVNKIAKFRRETAPMWPHVLFNPSGDILNNLTFSDMAIDKARAETPDE